MWELASRFPAFAFLFSVEPRLWMKWRLNPGGKASQSHELIYAAGLWESLKRDQGRSLPISIRANEGCFTLDNVERLIPPDAMARVDSIRLRMTRNSYNEHEFLDFMSKMPRLSSLSLVLSNAYPRPVVASLTYRDHRPIPLDGIAVSRLSLHNMKLDRNSLSGSRWRALSRLQLAYYRYDVQGTPIYEVLYLATSLSQLSIHIAAPATSFDRILLHFQDRDARYVSWRPQLTWIDIRGSYSSVPAFVSSLIKHPYSRLETVRVGYNYHHAPDRTSFRELPEFIEVGTRVAESAIVDVDGLRIELACRAPTGIRWWKATWKCYDLWKPDWVSHVSPRFCCRR